MPPKGKADNSAYQALKKDLAAGTLGSLYVFHGEEAYLRDYYLGQMKKKLLPAGMEEFNLHTMAGRDFDLKKLQELVEERKDEPEPLVLDKAEVKQLLAVSGVDAEKFEELEERYEETAGDQTEFLASNALNTRKFEIKTPDVVIQVNPERPDLVETRVIDGRQCLVIPVDDSVEVNGISVRALSRRACGKEIEKEMEKRDWDA